MGSWIFENIFFDSDSARREQLKTFFSDRKGSCEKKMKIAPKIGIKKMFSGKKVGL
jgi:hypothetical protein